ncbi:MAG TPA: histidine phosphatase family protein [Pyrinomonadaceae bacterium]|jgi:probable phosphoglycerate mutase|nr:histidine phosphatase family protein [Pyrinomonadaceae bacterium]
MKRVLLVRHALTAYDIAGPEGRFCGRSDPPLSAAGIEEAIATAEFLKEARNDCVFCSPLARAVQTADRIATARAIRVVKDPLLSEIDYGDWEGLTKQEVVTRFGDAYDRFAADPFTHYPPGGESTENCLARALEWINALTDDYVVAVTHKTWTRLLLCRLLAIPLTNYRRHIDVKIAGITVLINTSSGWRLDALNYFATRKRILGLES